VTSLTAEAPASVEPADAASPYKSRRLIWRILFASPSGTIAILFLLLLIVLAAAAPLIAPHDPDAQVIADKFAGPSGRYWLGTDALGRDVLSRLIYGTRIALLAPLISVGVALVIGVPFGILAGLKRGWTDTIASRITDTLLSLPGLAFALAIVAVLGPGLTNAMLALGITFAPRMFRIVRGATLAISEETYIHSAKVIGCSTRRTITSHVLPNIAAPLLVQTTIYIGIALIAEASLSFLGLGVQPPGSSWGTMLNLAYKNQYQAPYGLLPAGIAIILTVLACNTLGDVIRDVMSARRRG
jgi:peptide/nickel transport system permease protein